MIVIIDYQAGNLKSLVNALNRKTLSATVSADPKTILTAALVILPGVGAYRDASLSLKNSGLWNTLLERHRLRKPILGICLGMQLLFEDSDEGGSLTNGLALMKGNIRRLNPSQPELKVPHMGWNQLFPTPFLVNLQKPQTSTSETMRLKLQPYDGKEVYFVHSYGLIHEDPNSVLYYADHGQPIPAVVYQGTLAGFQFHPEKSGPLGEQLLAEVIDSLLYIDPNQP